MSLPRVFSLALSVLLLCAAVSAHAQTESDSTRSEDGPPALQEGGWGLQYEARTLDGLLSGFEGSLFSGRYHFSSRTAVRIGVSVDVSSSDSDETQSRTDAGSGTDETKIDRERTLQNYDLFAQYLRYVEASGEIYVFAGAGPRFGFENNNRDETRSRAGTDFEKENQEATSYRIGLGATIGAEWFVHPNVSLSVEYPLRFDYVHSERDVTTRMLSEDRTVEEERESDRYVLGRQSVRVGVTFSFGP
jgi:opacity protein-like surface antigen